MSNQSAVVDGLRRSFLAGKSLPIKFRKAQLENLLRLYDEGEDEVSTFRTIYMIELITTIKEKNFRLFIPKNKLLNTCQFLNVTK